jgi:hypothetical protein
MNVILLLDTSPVWKMDTGGLSLIQRHIDVIANTKSVQRLVISADPGWSSDQQFYKVSPFTMPAMRLRSWIRYSSASKDDQVYDIMKEMGWDTALVLGSFSPYLFTFMLDEIFSGIPNKEYGLRLVKWSEAVAGGLLAGFEDNARKLPVTQENIYYAYNEVIKGAAWEDVMEDLNGEQSSIPI